MSKMLRTLCALAIAAAFGASLAVGEPSSWSASADSMAVGEPSWGTAPGDALGESSKGSVKA